MLTQQLGISRFEVPRRIIFEVPRRSYLIFYKKKRRYLRGWPLFFEMFHVRVILDEIMHFITTHIQENSTKFVVKRDLHSTWQNCGHRFYSWGSMIAFATLSSS